MAGTDAAKRKQIHYVDPLADAFQPVYGGDTTAVPRAPAAKPRCEDIGYEHLWVCTPPVEVTEMQMPEKAFLPASRRCKNCGRVEKQVTEWRVVQEQCQ